MSRSTPVLVLCLVLLACGTEASDPLPPPAEQRRTDAGVVATALTYEADIQPILQSYCSGCHTARSIHPFADLYAEMLLPSQRCPGDLVGVCVGLAVENQVGEGDGCRTVVVRPFHREAWTPCLGDHERALIMAWSAGGMIER